MLLQATRALEVELPKEPLRPEGRQQDLLSRVRLLLPFQHGRDVPRQEKQDRERAEPGVIVRGPKDAGKPRSLKSQDVPDSAQHSTEAARHPGFANRRCTSLMERSRNPPSQ